MRLLALTACLLSTSHFINSASIPQSEAQFSNADLIAREPSSEFISPPSQLDPRSISPLSKRKGGGGGKGGGSSSSGASRSGSSSSSGGSGRYSSSSNVGGQTRSGSGAAPIFGNRYGGGATVPYAAGGRSPTRGFAPLFLPITAFAFFPAIWLYGSLYSYPYGNPYYYRNSTGQNATVDVTCLCQQYSVCGCDDDGDQDYLRSAILNGTDRPVNSSQVVILPPLANGTQQAFINGTLPNGTTASGGTEPSSDEELSNGAVRMMANYGGYWIMLITVLGTVVVL